MMNKGRRLFVAPPRTLPSSIPSLEKFTAILLHPIYPTLSCHTWMNLSSAATTGNHGALSFAHEKKASIFTREIIALWKTFLCRYTPWCANVPAATFVGNDKRFFEFSSHLTHSRKWLKMIIAHCFVISITQFVPNKSTGAKWKLAPQRCCAGLPGREFGTFHLWV